jgi:tRNA-specific 2-thiouridylase
MKKTVAVAMSGGLDSSYALLKLKEEGYDVFGVTLKLFCYGETEYSPKSCCSLEAIKDAKAICDSIDVPHMVVNGEEIFKNKVIDYFVDSYKNGLTPNPCVVCNSAVKWGFLMKKIMSYGADYLATGHYARVEYNEEKKRYLLKCGNDTTKDQSYYLWELTQEELSRTIFPLGTMKKEEVKKDMERYNLKISKKPESQEICFIPDNDYRKFLKDYGNVEVKPGNILNTSGEIIGQHNGYQFYTTGQRRGLGVSSEGRLYVKSIDHVKNEIILGKYDELFGESLIFSSGNFILYNYDVIKSSEYDLKARIRYRGKLLDCRLSYHSDNVFELKFKEPAWGICAGQSVVMYENDTVVGGGIIRNYPPKEFTIK